MPYKVIRNSNAGSRNDTMIELAEGTYQTLEDAIKAVGFLKLARSLTGQLLCTMQMRPTKRSKRISIDMEWLEE